MTVSSWFILLQALAGSPPNFDLAKLKAPDDCSSRIGREILVCGRQRSVDRVESGPTIDDGMPQAEMGLFGSVRGSLHGEQGGVGGFPSKRIMVTITAPF